jgi:hypothetical protein
VSEGIVAKQKHSDLKRATLNMHTANPLSLLQLIDQKQFKKLVKKWDVDKGVRRFSTWKMLSTLTCACIFRLKSYRCIESALGIKKSTLSDALRLRSCGFFEELCELVLSQICKTKSVGQSAQQVREFFALDSTECRIHSSLMRWPGWEKSRNNCASAKIHTVYNIGKDWVEEFIITNSCSSDLSSAKKLRLKANCCYVMDRAYFDLQFWLKIQQHQSHFVTRLKKSPRLSALKKAALSDVPLEQTGVLHDGTWTASESACLRQNLKPKTVKYRHVIYRDAQTQKEFDFITSDFDSKPEDIAALYKSRWSVELLFKWLKGYLDIRQLPVRSPNAARIILCMALLVRLLLNLKKLNDQSDLSLALILRETRTFLFSESGFYQEFQEHNLLLLARAADLSSSA